MAAPTSVTVHGGVRHLVTGRVQYDVTVRGQSLLGASASWDASSRRYSEFRRLRRRLLEARAWPAGTAESRQLEEATFPVTRSPSRASPSPSCAAPHAIQAPRPSDSPRG